MKKQSINIIVINTFDSGGGAEKNARDLNTIYKIAGHDSRLIVGSKRSKHEDCYEIPEVESLWYSFWRKADKYFQRLDGQLKGAWRLSRTCKIFAKPRTYINEKLGFENYDYPGIWKAIERFPKNPDIIHCHNLHGNYFDLRALPWLCKQAPVVLTLHDAWLLSGHCAHSFDCDKWRTGCGHCPDINIPPTIRRDATAHNWKVKREIMAQCRLYVATPSQWLMDKVNQSLLAESIIESKVIPNGVDLSVFKPGPKNTARSHLSIPEDRTVILASAHKAKQNYWKDYRTLRKSIDIIAKKQKGRRLLFIILGDGSPAEKVDNIDIQFVSYVADSSTLANYYNAADIFVHSTKADNHPLAILEAMSCGTPVIATAVGGIPEQVKGLKNSIGNLAVIPGSGYPLESANGILVYPQEPGGLAQALIYLLGNMVACEQLSKNARMKLEKQFNIEQQANSYLEWFTKILSNDKR